jgi:hypothetical protein
MTDMNVNSISKIVLSVITDQMKTILTKVAQDYNLPKDELISKYINIENITNISVGKKYKKRKSDAATLCMARKQDGNQCTRRKKNTADYCGKHIKNRKYGRIDDYSNIVDKLAEDDNYIMTWIEKFNGVEYLVDSNNVVYTNDVVSPKIIGKKSETGVLELVTSQVQVAK